MRSIAALLSVLLLTFPARAHDTGEEHDHEFGKPKPSGAFVLTGAFGGMIGSSLGGEYEECAAPTNCYERKRPFSSFLEARVGYRLPESALTFEAGLGYISGLSMTVARQTKLTGEQSTPVDVDIRDEVNVAGPLASVGAAYALIQKPIIGSVALAVGHWWGELETTRTGTAVTAEAPSPRTMKGSSKSEKANMVVLMPELRGAYPVLPNLHIGISLGAFLAFGDSRPRVVQTPEATPTDPQPSVPGDPGMRRAIGFVPQPNAEPASAMDNPVLFRSALYVSGVF